MESKREIEEVYLRLCDLNAREHIKNTSSTSVPGIFSNVEKFVFQIFDHGIMTTEL